VIALSRERVDTGAQDVADDEQQKQLWPDAFY
jgi:hypothetical protein